MFRNPGNGSIRGAGGGRAMETTRSPGSWDQGIHATNMLACGGCLLSRTLHRMFPGESGPPAAELSQDVNSSARFTKVLQAFDEMPDQIVPRCEFPQISVIHEISNSFFKCFPVWRVLQIFVGRIHCAFKGSCPRGRIRMRRRSVVTSGSPRRGSACGRWGR